MSGVVFTVHGIAAPAGSKRGFVRGGRVVITDASARSRPWKAQVTDAAIEAMQGRTLIDGPLALEIHFHIVRPKGHYRTGTNSHLIRESAPARPTVKPDLLKLARAVEDALTGVVYRDDAQVVSELLFKHYTTAGAHTYVRVSPVVEGVRPLWHPAAPLELTAVTEL